MSYTDVITALHSELVKTHRSHGRSTSGPARDIPALTASDMLTCAVLLTPGMVQAIVRTSTGYLGLPCMSEEFVWSTGEVNIGKLTSLSGIGSINTDGSNLGCGAAQYLAGWAVDGNGARRMLTDPRVKRSTVFVTCTTEDATHLVLLGFLRQVMHDWERMIVAMRAGILAYGIGPDIGKDACTEFLASLFSLASSLDVLRENPPPTLASEVKKAFREAAKATGAALEEAASAGGEAAAAVANTAGKIVGEAAGGFASGVGLAGLAVSGVVVFIAAKRFGWM